MNKLIRFISHNQIDKNTEVTAEIKLKKYSKKTYTVDGIVTTAGKLLGKPSYILACDLPNLPKGVYKADIKNKNGLVIGVANFEM